MSTVLKFYTSPKQISGYASGADITAGLYASQMMMAAAAAV